MEYHGQKNTTLDQMQNHYKAHNLLFKIVSMLQDCFQLIFFVVMKSCASITISLQSSMLNINTINFLSNFLFSTFASPTFAHAHFSNSHNKIYKSTTLLVSNGGKSMVMWLMFDILKSQHLTLATIPTFKIIMKI